MASPTSTVRPNAPTRNKSSSTLASAGTSFRAKRNKSSSSLHAGHHNVSFTHHSKKPGHKRTGSHAGRKPQIDFGFTSMKSEEAPSHADSDEDGDDEEHTPERPAMGHRRASSSSTVTGAQGGTNDRVNSKSRERDPGTPPEEVVEEEEPAPRPKAKSKKDKTVVGSLASTNASDWESATDSPAPATKPLPTFNAEGVSGLGQVFSVGDSVAATNGSNEDIVGKVKEEPTPDTPSKPGKAKGRPMFEIDDREDEDDSPPHEEQLPPNATRQAVESHQPPPTQQQQPTTPTMGDVHPSTPSPRDTPPKASTSTAPSPATNASPTSPQRHPRQGSTMRKSSNASLASMHSIRSLASFSGLMGPAPGLRRSASGAAPVLDRGEAHPSFGESKRPSHQKNDSLHSVRSLRSVAEGAHSSQQPRRAATMGPGESKDYARRARQGGSEGGSNAGGSSAMAALGSLGVAGRSSTTGPPSRSASGYFASLRGLAGLTPPVSPSSSRRSIPQPSTSASSRGKMKPSPTQFQPVISKFVEPAPSVLDTALSVSPANARGMLGGRNVSSASLSGGGAMSRTQQKALLARDAPYWANGTGPTAAEPSPSHIASSSTFYSQLPLPPPSQPTQAQQIQQQQSGKMVRSVSGEMQRQLGMQKWAVGLIREAERIERQYRTVEKWRDPLGESLERVLPSQVQPQVARKPETQPRPNKRLSVAG